MINDRPASSVGTSLAILACLAIVAFLFVAKVVFIPIAVAITLSYALTPVVAWGNRTFRLPTALGAAITLSLLIAGAGFGMLALQNQAVRILEIVPQATAKMSAALRHKAREPAGTVEKIQKAATEIEKAANAATAASAAHDAADAASANTAHAAGVNIRSYLLGGTASAISAAGQALVVFALAYFILIAGDTFRRTLVRVSGNSLSRKKLTVQILDEIDLQIQRYLLVQLATSALLALVTWAIFSAVGLQDALFWACIGGVLHLIPYVGPAIFLGAVALFAYVQFDSVQATVLVVGGGLLSVGLVGLLLVPWLTQKMGRLNAVTVFVALLFWGWMWGIWGLLLGVPIVMAMNAVFERVEELQPISAFLSSAPRGRARADAIAPAG